jgi:ethanolamine utilization microcompartment shell protein EutL
LRFDSDGVLYVARDIAAVAAEALSVLAGPSVAGAAIPTRIKCPNSAAVVGVTAGAESAAVKAVIRDFIF